MELPHFTSAIEIFTLSNIAHWGVMCKKKYNKKELLKLKYSFHDIRRKFAILTWNSVVQPPFLTQSLQFIVGEENRQKAGYNRLP